MAAFQPEYAYDANSSARPKPGVRTVSSRSGPDSLTRLCRAGASSPAPQNSPISTSFSAVAATWNRAENATPSR